LYNDYSNYKNKIYNNLIKNNPKYDKLTLFKKSQKFLDRLLFVFFAEDTGLVPPNAISKIVEQWQIFIDNDEYFTLYSRFVKFFGHLNKGHKYKTYNLPAYNGGLFAPDEILDNVIIDDEILKDDALLLSSYDFNTDVDVNILGHIFEHSLNEIEEITAEITATSATSHIPFPKTNKRKKDGVFYTPKYITQYIVENTIGKLCSEKREDLNITEIEFDGTFKTKDGKLSVKGKKLFNTLDTYKEWLKQLKIIDPACGSGAFLNQALSFLIEEHKQIDDIIAELTGEKIRLFDTDKGILENNLYGVDINEESVEIAKLSLWLRTAQKDRKLSNLSNNIKCGNSLINDPEIAGNKAFNWRKEFPQAFKSQKVKLTKHEIKQIDKDPNYLALIEHNAKLAQEKAKQAVQLSQEAIKYSEKVYEFAKKQNEVVSENGELYGINKGGFDVVIGNPPYFPISTLNKQSLKFLKENYINADKSGDIYCLFYELGINILKPNGLISFITSNQWLQAQYGKTLRNYFVTHSNPVELINFSGVKIFKDATIDSSIFISKKEDCDFNLKACKFLNNFKGEDIKTFISQNSLQITNLKADRWFIIKQDISKLRKKIKDKKPVLKEHNIIIKYGIKNGFNEAFIIDTPKKD
ncbi:MAG: BREX-1 system adenine-specific DNA-methyltransferase PglX, partial [Draconibacterium sp.]|nr:BREX-1 system adenine-specific DNA-methyltransferase PglX [Draconibacterium sp.]